MLVAFPIGLFVTSFIFDLISRAFDKPAMAAAGWYCVIAGLIGGAAAALPGVIDLLTVVPPNSSGKKRGFVHGGLNVCMLGVFIAVAAYRGSSDVQPNNTSLVLSAIGVFLLAISGWLGATLVYRNQIGVDHRYANAGKWKERTLESWQRPVCNESELADGQMMLARVGSERVVIARCSDGISAFSDHCTHKGGPLSDGTLVGCTVQCPWHGSQFDVHTGRVVAGPAEQKIDLYTVQVRSGEVFVIPSQPQGSTAEKDKAA
jgi:nitrite reductase/ring-hydroxylating ferredoxin subunit/uncharacterized membrane protein